MHRPSALVVGIAGALAGALLLYPYAAFVDRLVHIHDDGRLRICLCPGWFLWPRPSLLSDSERGCC